MTCSVFPSISYIPRPAVLVALPRGEPPLVQPCTSPGHRRRQARRARDAERMRTAATVAKVRGGPVFARVMIRTRTRTAIDAPGVMTPEPLGPQQPPTMSIDWKTLLTVVVAMIVYKILDGLFLGAMLGKITGSFEQLT